MNRESLDNYLRDVRDGIDKGISASRITVRDLLGILEAYRRGSNVNACINELLDEYELVVEPSFEWEYIDNEVEVKTKKDESTEFDTQTNYRIDGLESANTQPVSVTPDDDLSRAVTIMTANNFSQVPVMTNGRTVKGVVTWKSIAEKLFFDAKKAKARDYMVKPEIIDDDFSMFDAIERIRQNDYILVRSTKDSTIKGIVTSSDLSEQFGALSQPFLLIGKCEFMIRRLIHGKFSKEELESAKNELDESRKIESIHDLTFGEYIRLLENKNNWDRLHISLDRKYMVEKMTKIRDIRNDIMHFDPNVSNQDQIDEIRSFNHLLEYALKEIGSV